jgi:Coenzyme PQQ synthesis protein D (PqqD)
MTTMTGSTRYQLPDDVVLQGAQDEALLVKLNAEDLFALNETGAAIVQRLADGQDVDALIDDLARIYESDRADVARDVHALVADLLQHALLVARPPAGEPQA